MKQFKKQHDAVLLAKYEPKLFQRGPGRPWRIKLQAGGERHTFSTKKVDKHEAAIVANEIYEHLLEHGAAKTIEKYDTKSKAGAVVTSGDLIKKVEAVWLGQARTLQDYTTAVRRVVSEIKDVERDKADTIKIADIAHADIEAWRVAYIKAAGSSHARKDAARTSSNTILRACKALFGKKLLKKKLQLPELPNPFADIELSQKGL